MRVDNPASGQPNPLVSREKLRSYGMAFRRRWYLVLVPAVLGSAFGFVTASSGTTELNKVGVSKDVVAYCKAAHILTVKGTNVSEGTTAEGPDLIQTAYLANAGVVPKRVAEQLKMKARDVQDSVIGFPREEVGSVEVVAVGKDPDLVVKLADTTAVNLILEARSQSSTGTEEQRAEIMERLAALDLQITELDERISEDPADLAQLQAQLSSLTTVYSTTYE